jgi:hypothetical protein
MNIIHYLYIHLLSSDKYRFRVRDGRLEVIWLGERWIESHYQENKGFFEKYYIGGKRCRS